MVTALDIARDEDLRAIAAHAVRLRSACALPWPPSLEDPTPTRCTLAPGHDARHLALVHGQVVTWAGRPADA